MGIYDSYDWKLIRVSHLLHTLQYSDSAEISLLIQHFALPTPSTDIVDLDWSPCGGYIAVWEAITEVCDPSYFTCSSEARLKLEYANSTRFTFTHPTDD